jgi:hypothetical protein
LLAVTDAAIFSSYCQSYADWLALVEEVRNLPSRYYKTDSGSYKPLPHLHDLTRLQTAFMQAARSLGLAVSERSSIKAGSPAEVDPFVAYQQKRANMNKKPA